MSTVGDADMWAPLFPDGLVTDIIALVMDGWQGFPKPRRDEREPRITGRFREHLRKEKGLRMLPFTIWPESSETDPDTGEETGRLDLRFLRGWREDVYFAIECKRLNVMNTKGSRSSLAGPYVEEGMMRFVSGKYARGLDKGGMLGYVMDGQVGDAIKFVDRAVRRRRPALFMRGRDGLSTSSVRECDTHVKETRHELSSREFVIHHLFVAVV